ncbi:uncharacterized protein [Malus domestica]|uniref:uncharacterized protein n=1 Tax=Malus domestica TaxID=3750 RepID=UPI0004986D1A
MYAYTIHLVDKDNPVKYVRSKPILTGRLAKWALRLNQYEIIYFPAKVVKEQALADFLTDHPIPADWKVSGDLPDKEVFYIDIVPTWTMLFDGSARRQVLPYSFRPNKLCSNNVAEYQTLIIGLQMMIDMEITTLEVYGDSKLMILDTALKYVDEHLASSITKEHSADMKEYF